MRTDGPGPADGERVWGPVVALFAASRSMLLLAAWFGRYFPRDLRYGDAEAAARGWQWVPWRALDVWGRWDTGHYLRIASEGYRGDAGVLLAFFPGYPALVRAVASVAGPHPSTRALYLAAVAVSNVAAVPALVLLHRLATDLLGDAASARRTVLYALAFPASLFLSCAYSESLFLLLGVAAFRSGLHGRWRLAGACGFLLALTRPVGVLFVVPLAWMYLEERGFDLRRVRADVAWLALVPAGLAAYAAYGWSLTGDPAAVFRVQAAWGRSLSWPWTTLAHPRGFHGYMTRIDGALVVASALLGVWALSALRTRAAGLLLLLLVAPPLTSGTLMSGTRFLAVAFPLFLALARLGRNELLDRAYLLHAVALQALFMAAWSQFHWLG